MSTSHESIKHDKAGPNKFLHPKGRKCVALMKSMKKDSKKAAARQETKLRQSLIAEKLLWFKNHIDPTTESVTNELVADLVEEYISRNDEELEQILLKRSIGSSRKQQHIGRENAIRLTKERETNDYNTCGFEIPNILDSTQLKMLLKWKGDLKFLPNFKFRRFVKKQTNEKQKVSQNTITDISNTQEETSKADKSLADEKMEAMES